MAPRARILIVCMGNTCRSPMAVALLRSHVPEDVLVESAGVAAADGLPAAQHAVQVMREREVDIAAHASRSIEHLDLSRYDLVLALSRGVADAIVRRGADPERVKCVEVDDPHCRGIEAYRMAADRLECELAPVAARFQKQEAGE